MSIVAGIVDPVVPSGGTTCRAQGFGDRRLRRNRCVNSSSSAFPARHRPSPCPPGVSAGLGAWDRPLFEVSLFLASWTHLPSSPLPGFCPFLSSSLALLLVPSRSSMRLFIYRKRNVLCLFGVPDSTPGTAGAGKPDGHSPCRGHSPAGGGGRWYLTEDLNRGFGRVTAETEDTAHCRSRRSSLRTGS